MQTILRSLAGPAVAIVISACHPAADRAGTRGDELDIPAVEAVQARSGTLPLEERLAGSVVARNQTQIFPEVSGRIVAVLVNDGDRVEAGSVLVRLRATEFEEQLQQAEAGLRVADARVRQAEANEARVQAVLRRTETVVERSLGSAAELEAAQAEALTAEAELLLARAEREQAESVVAERRSALEQTTIRAPIAGIVGRRNAEVGQIANASTPLFVIGDTGAMRVTITLTQRMLAYMEVGTPVNVTSDDQSEPLSAEISRISPFLQEETPTTTAEIDVEEPGALRPGMFVTVDVLYGQSETAILVPNNALYTDARVGREGVWLAHIEEPNAPLEPGAAARPQGALDPTGPVTVEFLPVEVVARGRFATAVGGLSPGQWVVTIGHELLAQSSAGRAVIQPTPWDHIMRLQQLQSRDLLDLIRSRQGEDAQPAL